MSAHGTRPFPKGTLSRELVVRVVALLSTMALAMAVLSSWWVYVSTLDSLDHDVVDLARRDFDAGRGPGTGGGNRQYAHAGKPVGSVSVVKDASGTINATLVTADAGSPIQLLTDDDLDEILAVDADNRVHTVGLSIGMYRVVAGTQRPVGGQPSRPGGTPPTFVATGLPLAPVHNQVIQVAVAEGAIALVLIVIGGLATSTLVGRSLRPLTQLATTARDVAGMELDRGEVEITTRVPLVGSADNEVVRVASAFNTMLDHVDDALASRQASETKVRQFVADASHELRNPLASIRGYAEITRRERAQLPADTAFAIGRIESESARMSALVEDMLLLARLDDNPTLERAPLDLTELVVMAVSDAQVAGQDHTWRLDLPAEPLQVGADRNRLQQVVVNLLTNARTHTPAGTTVTTSVRADGTMVEVVVADDGPGVPHELQEKVFERFVRADPSRVRQGRPGGSTGLGLAIVRSVVESHGGTIVCHSVPGNTRFIMRLPRLAANPQP